jgi:hypothetical protein
MRICELERRQDRDFAVMVSPPEAVSREAAVRTADFG